VPRVSVRFFMFSLSNGISVLALKPRTICSLAYA
jgi:hypothetical protein